MLLKYVSSTIHAFSQREIQMIKDEKDNLNIWGNGSEKDSMEWKEDRISQFQEH